MPFTVDVEGIPDPTIKWLFNGTEIEGSRNQKRFVLSDMYHKLHDGFYQVGGGGISIAILFLNSNFVFDLSLALVA